MTVDFTQVVLAIVALSLPGPLPVLPVASEHIKDQRCATIGTAVKNSLGAAQNAIDAGLQYHPLQASLPTGTSPAVRLALNTSWIRPDRTDAPRHHQQRSARGQGRRQMALRRCRHTTTAVTP